VVRLRKVNSTLRSDLDSVSESTQRMMEANFNAERSFSSLSGIAKENQNKSEDANSVYKQQIQDLKLAQDEMRDEIKMKQAAYVAEVRSRKQYEEGMGRMVDIIQSRSHDSRLVEAIFQISEDVEYQQQRDPDDASVITAPRAASVNPSMVGRFTSYFSPP
jgi:hypothetical protein